LLATLTLGTGSRLDEFLAAELTPFATWQVQLDAALARHGRFPAIDLRRSWSRNADRLLEPGELEALIEERRQLEELDAATAWDRIFAG
jgi:transcription termination factor Rho